MRTAALVLVALALTGCETTAEKSAKLEAEAKRQSVKSVQKGLSITRESTQVKVLRATLVNGTEGSAAIVTLRNTSAWALRDIPVAITVRDAGGATVYSNSAPGLSHTLVSAPLLPPHGTLTWIDDQVHATGGAPASVSARVGEAPTTTGMIPRISVEGAHLAESPSNEASVEGTVLNHSAVAQAELVVYALARRSGRIVAAGRAILPSVPAGGSAAFQAFLIGNPKDAQLTVAAPPTTIG